MKQSHLFYVAALAILAGACADDTMSPAARAPQSSQFSQISVEGRYMVGFDGSASALEAAVTAAGGTVESAHDASGIAVVSGIDAAVLQAVEGVQSVEEDALVELGAEPVMLESGTIDGAVSSVSNPAAAIRHSYQWNMRAVKANVAWAAGELGSPSITVAILDTGLDYDAYDMSAVVDVARSKSFVPNDDAIVQAFFPGRHPIDDLNGHGTNVATQASSGGVLFAGVTSRTRIIGVKVLGYNGSGSLAGIVNGLLYAADQGADVANMSLGVRGGSLKAGSEGYVGAVNRAFNYANRKGMTVVVSAGNDAIDMDANGNLFQSYCDAPHVICVSATGPTASTNAFSGPWQNVDSLTSYSNFGKPVTVAAPGGTNRGWVASQCARHRLSVSPTGVVTAPCNTAPGFFIATGYAGTSQAAPHVAGLAASIKAKYGKSANVKHILAKNSDDLGDKGDDAAYGDGRINVAKALGL
jgi:lantibiotic leader peptide-processing serine protease